MKSYFVIFGSLATAIAVWLAGHSQGLGSLGLCIAASASFIAAAVFRPDLGVSNLETKVLLTIGSIDQNGISINELKECMKTIADSTEPLDEDLRQVIMRFEIAGICEYKEGKLYKRR